MTVYFFTTQGTFSYNRQIQREPISISIQWTHNSEGANLHLQSNGNRYTNIGRLNKHKSTLWNKGDRVCEQPQEQTLLETTISTQTLSIYNMEIGQANHHNWSTIITNIQMNIS
jgi:hypothetical protein